MEGGPIRFEGTLAEREFLAMQRLASPRWVRFWPWLLIAMIAVVFATGGYRNVSAEPLQTTVGFLPAAAVIAFFAIFQRLAVKRAWRKNALIKTPVSGQADGEGIEWTGQYTHGRFPWAILREYRQSQDMVIVFTQPRSVLFFPRRFFATEAEWQRFVTLASGKVAKQGSRGGAQHDAAADHRAGSGNRDARS